MTELVKVDGTEWYEALVEECQAIITEAIWNSRLFKIKGFHELGKTLVENVNFVAHAKGNKSLVQDLARNIGVGERNIYNAINCYKKYPDLNMLPEGKNISWNKIVTKYLPSAKKEEKPPKIIICPQCGYEIDK